MHVLQGHADMADQMGVILETVGRPDAITPDPIRGRWRYWRAGVGPTRWLFVVVDWSALQPLVITAYGRRKVRL
jgi:hypothetical protein